MKKLLPILIAVMLSACNQKSSPDGVITDAGRCSNGEKQYWYQYNGIYHDFIDSCGKFHVGDTIINR